MLVVVVVEPDAAPALFVDPPHAAPATTSIAASATNVADR
jgi:hypothetical protein